VHFNVYLNYMKIIQSLFAGIGSIGYPLASLIVLVISDGLITNFLVGEGTALELNPLLRNLAGNNSLLVIKVIGALLCALILWDIYRRRPKLAMISSWCFVGAYLGIVLWNSSVLFISR